MLLSNCEYILLRLIRKFLFPNKFRLWFGRYIPYYGENQGVVSPTPIVDSYFKYCSKIGVRILNKTVLEIGVGATNGTGYEIIARHDGGYYWCYEPFESLNANLDKIFLSEISKHFHKSEISLKDKVERVRNIEELKPKSIDLIFSNAVLEHVTDLPNLIAKLHRVLKDDGAMIHLVDYGDHFRKYPYHFLQFSEKIWNLFLNPGDLPRYRLYHHLEICEQNGFLVTVIEKKSDYVAFSKIKNHIHNEFRRLHGNNDLLAVNFAVIAARKSEIAKISM